MSFILRKHARVVLLASLAVAAAALADTLKLKDGATLTGRKISDMPNRVVFRDHQGKLHFIPKDEVAGFEQSAPPPEAPVQPILSYRAADISRWTELARVPAHNVPVAAVAAKPGGRTVLTCGGPDICFWDGMTGRRTREFAASSKPLSALAISADGRLVLAGDTEGLISLWTASGEPAAKLIQAGRGAVNGLAFTPSGRQAVAGTQNGALCVLDLQRGVLSSQHETGAEVLGVAVSPDGLRALAPTTEGAILWDIPMARQLARLAPAKSAVFLPGGAEAATCWRENVQLWDALAQPKRKERLARALAAPGHDLTCLAVTPSGRYVLAGATDGAIIAWDILTTLPSENPWLAVFEGHKGAVNALAFSSDGSRFYSAGADRTLRVWGWKKDKRPPSPAVVKETP